MDKVIHIALTGHRPNKLGGYDISTDSYKKLQKDLENKIASCVREGYIVWCHGGCALGADTIWAQAALAMKQQFPGKVKYYAHIPFMSQPDAWRSQEDILRWNKHVSAADARHVYHKNPGDIELYDEKKAKRLAGKFLNDRNIGMVDSCNVLIAVLNPDDKKSGTRNAVNYAKKQDKMIRYIDSKKYFG